MEAGARILSRTPDAGSVEAIAPAIRECPEESLSPRRLVGCGQT